MAQSMKDIKRRIKSVKNIKQITNAMELVSSAKLRKSRKKLEQTRPYYETVSESIRELLAETKGVDNPLLEKREIKKRAVIVLTADRGLAGAYNANAIRKAEEILEDGVDTILVTSGVKGTDYFKYRKYEIEKSMLHISENPKSQDAAEIGEYVLELYRKKEIDQVLIVYTRFNSALNLVPMVEQILPAENLNQKNRDNKEYKPIYIEYEPDPYVLLDKMISQYINISVFGYLLESSASQQAARRTAMENATDNAEELIEDLGLKYNRARQASITQEISEIVGGAEALK